MNTRTLIASIRKIWIIQWVLTAFHQTWVSQERSWFIMILMDLLHFGLMMALHVLSVLSGNRAFLVLEFFVGVHLMMYMGGWQIARSLWTAKDGIFTIFSVALDYIVGLGCGWLLFGSLDQSPLMALLLSAWIITVGMTVWLLTAITTPVFLPMHLAE